MHPTLRFQVVSDLHVELKTTPVRKFIQELRPTCDNLALCGDIGRPGTDDYQAILKHCSDSWKRVFVTLGNHEYYRSKESSLEQKFEESCSSFSNVYSMNRRKVEFDGWRVLGCTLWSNVPDEAIEAVEDHMSDYNQIMTDDMNRFTVKDTNRKHIQNLSWLEGMLKTDNNTPTVILTHHAPLMKGTSSPVYETGSLTQHGFATDLSRLLGGNIKMWAFGHTHWQCDFYFSGNVNGTRIVTNARGYSGNERFRYNPSKVFDLQI